MFAFELPEIINPSEIEIEVLIEHSQFMPLVLSNDNFQASFGNWKFDGDAVTISFDPRSAAVNEYKNEVYTENWGTIRFPSVEQLIAVKLKDSSFHSEERVIGDNGRWIYGEYNDPLMKFKSRSLRIDELNDSSSLSSLNLPQNIEIEYTQNGFYYSKEISYDTEEYRKSIEKNSAERYLLTTDDLLSDTDNFDLLPKNIQDTIFASTNSTVREFRKNFIFQFNYNLVYYTYSNCVDRADPNIAQLYYDAGYGVTTSTLASMYTDCDKKANPGFQTNVKFKPLEKSLSWKQLVAKYNNDYLEISRDGFSKDNLNDLKISQSFNNLINLDPNTTNVFFVESRWNKGPINSTSDDSDDISKLLSLHNISEREEKLYGTYTLPKVNIFDVYRINKYYKISQNRETSYKGPKVKFSLDDTDQSFTVPLWKIPGIASLSEEFANAISYAVSDIASESLIEIRDNNIRNNIEEEKNIINQTISSFKISLDENVKRFSAESDRQELYSKLPDILNFITKTFLINPNEKNTQMINDFIDNHYEIEFVYTNADYYKVNFSKSDYFETMAEVVKDNNYPLEIVGDRKRYITFMNQEILTVNESAREVFGKKFDINGEGFDVFAVAFFFKLASLDLVERNKFISKYQKRFQNVEKGTDKVFGGYNYLLIDYFTKDFTKSGRSKTNKKFQNRFISKGNNYINSDNFTEEENIPE